MRYVVIRQGPDNRNPFQVGEEVTTYELDEDYPFVGLEPHGGHDQAELDYMAAVEADMTSHSLWREESAAYCRACPKGKSRKLVSILIHTPSARRWVVARPERRVAEFRGSERVEGWPMHGAPGEAPHVAGIASCPGCRKRWLVTATHDKLHLLGVTAVQYGAKIVP